MSLSSDSAAAMVRDFSCSVTICQKYCAAVFSTVFSARFSCKRLASSATLASLLPFTICPPAKTGCVADTPATMPCFNMEKLMGAASPARASGGSICANVAPSSGEMTSDGLMSIVAMGLLALNHSPVALTLGKKLVKACLRCSCAASTLCRAAVAVALLRRASWVTCSSVYCCPLACRKHRATMMVEINCFMCRVMVISN